ncbi:conserved Plasmodium protein, unknown function [Plasmodium gaboni]|uniref:RAP protein n=1 Tax=Plasmodium gaboni TaxID=647221 RepID=A0ABY1UTA3_9APIC|nr:conserved Plasmodium protein, unknown function [Plasmodium gaboni]
MRVSNLTSLLKNGKVNKRRKQNSMCFLFWGVKRYESTRVVSKNETKDNIKNKECSENKNNYESSEICSYFEEKKNTNININKNDSYIKMNEELNENIKHSNLSRKTYDILKYYDDNKNIIKTTRYILKEHINYNIYIKELNTFYNYFYNAYPFFITKYINYFKEHILMNYNDNIKTNSFFSNYKNNEDIKKFLSLFHYFNDKNNLFINNHHVQKIILKSLDCPNNVTQFLRGLKDNIYFINNKNKKDLLEIKKMFCEKIIECIDNINDINKKIEILLYLSNICDKDKTYDSIYYIHINKKIEQIYNELNKKNKKTVEDQYMMFLLYKEYLSSKNEKYAKMDIKNFLSQELSFYNFLKNENINICLLSLIYRDLSFLNNYEIKYVLMNLVYSKISCSEFFLYSSKEDLVNNKNIKSHVLFKEHNNNMNINESNILKVENYKLNDHHDNNNMNTQINHNNNMLNSGIRNFFANSLLRNNFFASLRNEDMTHSSNILNYNSHNVNNTNIYNYVFYNLLTSIIQLNESQKKSFDVIFLNKMKLFLLHNQKHNHNLLIPYILKIKENVDYMNNFLFMNNIFLIKYVLKYKHIFSNNLYLYILNVFSNTIHMIKKDHHFTDINKRNINLLNDCKKIINYFINEIYYSINLYTLKEFIQFVNLLNKFPSNFTFEIKNNLYHQNENKIENINKCNIYDNNIMDITNILHFNNENISSKLDNNIKYDNNNNNIINKNPNIPSNIKDNNKNIIKSNISDKQNNVLYSSILNTNNFKTKKNTHTIINKDDFIILISLSIFNEINEDFILKIKEKEKDIIKNNNIQYQYQIYEYIIEHHYIPFINNTSNYVHLLNQKYDENTREQIMNYFIMFTYINQLDISEICSLVNVMHKINKFQSFIDFYISKHIQKLLNEKLEHVMYSKGSGKKKEMGNYEFDENYLDDYISKMNIEKSINKVDNINKVDSTNIVNNPNSVNENDSVLSSHFEQINLNTHFIYTSNFEKYYYDYDMNTSIINLFILLNEKSQTRNMLATFLPYIDYTKINIFKINLNKFFSSSYINNETNNEKENIIKVKEANERYKDKLNKINNFNTTPFDNNTDTTCNNNNNNNNNSHSNYYSDKSASYTNILNGLFGDSFNINKNEHNQNINNNYEEYTLNHPVIYNIIQSRLRYNINLKNYLENNEKDITNEETKQFLKKEILSLQNITSLISYINNIKENNTNYDNNNNIMNSINNFNNINCINNNDNNNYSSIHMDLLNLALKNLIFCKNDIVDIKSYRLISNVLLNINNIYQKIYISSKYSYLNILIMNYIKRMETFLPFFNLQDYLQILQIYIKYNLSNIYMKYLYILNNELNKINIKNINYPFVYIILYFYFKLNYVNETFVFKLLNHYISSLKQQQYYMDSSIIQNLIKTNDVLINLCVKNKEILYFNYMILQKYGNFKDNLELEENLEIDQKNNEVLEQNNMEHINEHITSAIKINDNRVSTNHMSSSFHPKEEKEQNINMNHLENNTNNNYNNNNKNNNNNYQNTHYMEQNNENTINYNFDTTQYNNLEGNQKESTSQEEIDNSYYNTNDINYNSNQINQINNTNNSVQKNNVTSKFELSLKQKLNIMYFLCKFHFYNETIKMFYLQVINECMNNKNANLNDEDYCKLYEIYVQVILNFYFLSFNKNNKYINYILSNLPCYYWYKRQEDKLNFFLSSKEYNNIHHILKLVNLPFLVPTLTEIYFIHLFNDSKNDNYNNHIPNNCLHYYQKYNLLIDDIKNKNIAILCVPEENELRDGNHGKRILMNESYYIYENIKKTYATSLLFLSEWNGLSTEGKCDYILKVIHSAINN